MEYKMLGGITLRTRVNKWIKSYLDNGLTGLQEKAHTGRPKGLTNLQLLQLKNFVTTTSIKPNGGRLQGKDVQAYIETEFSRLIIKKLTYITSCIDSI